MRSPSTGLIYLTSQGGTTAEYESRGFTCFIRPPNIYISKTGAANIAIPVPAPAVQELGEYDWGCHQSIHSRGFFRTCMHRLATIATIELTKATLIIAQSVSKPWVILTTVRNIRSVEQILKATNRLIETTAGMPRWISALKLALRDCFTSSCFIWLQ